MATPDVTQHGIARGQRDRPGFGTGVARLSTETTNATKTTEFYAFLVVLAGILIAGASVDAGDFGAARVWLYATILTVGYMVSRGLAKAGSREPYDADRDRDGRRD